MKQKSLLIGAYLMGILSILSLSNCSGIKPETYQEMSPKFDLKEFFTGKIKGYGIIQEAGGEVVSRFDVNMIGTWEGNKGVLDETFDYYGAEADKRIWKITKLDDINYEGTASDIIGKAIGTMHGNAMRWQYEMDVKRGDGTIRLTFDDWMWMMEDGVVINRSYLKKFGITVAELTLFMQKVK